MGFWERVEFEGGGGEGETLGDCDGWSERERLRLVELGSGDDRGRRVMELRKARERGWERVECIALHWKPHQSQPTSDAQVCVSVWLLSPRDLVDCGVRRTNVLYVNFGNKKTL